MTRMLTILSLVALPLVGCDHDGGSGPGFMSGMGMGSGVTNATSGYGFDENFEATYGTVPAARGEAGGDWMEIRPGQPIDVNAGVLSGDYGDLVVASESGAEISGFSDGFWTEVNLVVETPKGVAMAIFEVWGDLDGLESGTTRTYNRFEGGSLNSTYVSVIGCAGPELYDWTYDSPAVEVEVNVSDDPQQGERRVYEFTARFEELREGWGGSELARWEMKGQFEGPTSASSVEASLP